MKFGLISQIFISLCLLLTGLASIRKEKAVEKATVIWNDTIVTNVPYELKKNHLENNNQTIIIFKEDFDKE